MEGSGELSWGAGTKHSPVGKCDKVSRNNDNRKHSLAENGSKASGNRTGKKGRNRNPVDKKRLDQMRAVNSRIDRKPAGSRIKDAMLPAEAAFLRTAFAPSSDESITSSCIGPRS